jgi:polar amino acid transport system substrate-binding protein
VLALCVLAASYGPAAAAVTSADPALPKLTIASEGARPPYNYFDGDKLAGFEIDLGRDLCLRMAVTCTFVAQDWDGMIPGLLAHRYDAIMAAMEITDERKAKIAFTLPYVRMPSAFMVKMASGLASDSPAALAGKTIGVEKGGTHENFLLEKYPDSTIRRYSSLSDAILDLEADRVDAVIGDKDAIVTFLETRSDARCCHILADVPRDPVFFGDGIGIGLRKDDTGLRARFEKALAASVADGAFARISAKYFDFPIN